MPVLTGLPALVPGVLPAALAAGAVAVALGLPRVAAVRLRQTMPGVTGEPVRRFASWPGVLLLVLALHLWLGAAATLALSGAALAAVAHRRRGKAARSVSAERRSVVAACTALAAELRAGRSAAEALTIAAGLAEGDSRIALSGAAAAAGFGGDVSTALLSSGPGAAPEVLRGLAACWHVCAGAGHGLAPTIDRLADGLRSRQAQERAVESALAGPRASAGLLAMLPLAGVGLAAGLGAHPVHVLLRTPVGVVCLVAGVALDCLGLWWTRHLVTGASGRRR